MLNWTRFFPPARALLVAVSLILGVPNEAAGLTLAAEQPPPAQRVAGRVASADPHLGADGVLRTHIVLVDTSGNECARFAVPGGVVGDARWVADGIPVFFVGEMVDVALGDSPAGLTVAPGDDAVVRLAPGADGRSGAHVLAEPPTVLSLSPDQGGATPGTGTLVTVRGARFGATQGDSRVTFQGFFERVDAPVVSWSDEVVECRIPRPGLFGSPQVLTGTVKVWTAAGGWSDGHEINHGPRFRVHYQWGGDHWPIARLPVRVWMNPDGFPGGAGAASMVAASIESWNTPGSYARLEYAGLTNAVAGPHADGDSYTGDGRNTVQWREVWPYFPGVLAIAWSLIDTLTYERREFDIEINGSGHAWMTAEDGDFNGFDLPSTLTHELGHGLRLLHTYFVTSVMTFVAVPGQRRRVPSGADRLGASFIHPSYGTITAPATIAEGLPLEFAVVARDREGKPRTDLDPGRVRADIVPLEGMALPSPLEPQLSIMPLVSAFGDRPTDGDGATAVRVEPLPRGLYRIEVTVDGQLVRPVPVVRVGEAPRVVEPGPALAGVVPQPLGAGGRGIVRFALPQSTHLKLDLFDVRGQHVRVVADERFPAGGHEVPLWTRDETGRTMAPGIYFLRMIPIAGAAFAPLSARLVVLP